MNPLREAERMAHLRKPRGWAAVFFGDTTLDVAAARTTGGQFAVGHQDTAILPSSDQDGSPQTRWASAVQAVRQRLDPREHRIVTAVACEDVFCQTLRLPTGQPSELEQMLALQIDNLAPLPVEEIVYGFEPLDKTDTETRVLVAVARKAAVNERVGVLESAGLPPEIVGIDTLALFRGLLRRNLLPQDDKLNSLVQLTPTAVNIIVYSRGQPLAVRSLVLDGTTAAGAEPQAVLREELRRTLVAAQADQPGSEMGRVTFATWSERMRPEVETLARDWGEQAECITDGAAPPPAVSLCEETAAPAAARLNLLPDEWRQRRRAKQVRRMLIRGGIVVAAVYVFGLLVFGLAMGIQKARLSRVEREAKSLRHEYDNARELHSLLVSMQKQLDTQYSVLEVLREVCVLKPENLQFSRFDFKKDQTVAIQGQTPSANVANDFISSLEKCPLFSKVTPGAMRSDPGGGGLTKFDVTCILKSAAAAPSGTPYGAK